MKARLERLEPTPDAAERGRIELAKERIRELFPTTAEWKTLNAGRRYWVLESVGRALARIYETGEPELRTEALAGGPGFRVLGLFDGEADRISLDETAMRTDDPGEALDTFLHEWRHAYQREMARRVATRFHRLCPDAGQALEWRRNLEPGGYTLPEVNPTGYRDQSVERDAREFAKAAADAWRRNDTPSARERRHAP